MAQSVYLDQNMARLTQRPLRQRQTQSGRPRLQIQSAKAIEEGVWHPVLVQRNSLKIGSIPRLCQVQTSSGVSVESTGPFGHGSADASSYPNIFENEESFASPEPLLKTRSKPTGARNSMTSPASPGQELQLTQVRSRVLTSSRFFKLSPTTRSQDSHQRCPNAIAGRAPQL